MSRNGDLQARGTHALAKHPRDISTRHVAPNTTRPLGLGRLPPASSHEADAHDAMSFPCARCFARCPSVRTKLRVRRAPPAPRRTRAPTIHTSIEIQQIQMTTHRALVCSSAYFIFRYCPMSEFAFGISRRAVLGPSPARLRALARTGYALGIGSSRIEFETPNQRPDPRDGGTTAWELRPGAIAQCDNHFHAEATP